MMSKPSLIWAMSICELRNQPDLGYVSPLSSFQHFTFLMSKGTKCRKEPYKRLTGESSIYNIDWKALHPIICLRTHVVGPSIWLSPAHLPNLKPGTASFHSRQLFFFLMLQQTGFLSPQTPVFEICITMNTSALYQ